MTHFSVSKLVYKYDMEMVCMYTCMCVYVCVCVCVCVNRMDSMTILPLSPSPPDQLTTSFFFIFCCLSLSESISLSAQPE